MSQPALASNVTEVAKNSTNLTATGVITANDALFLGFNCNSTTSGTVVFREGGASGTILNGAYAPTLGYNAFPKQVTGGVHVTIANTLDATFFYTPNLTV
jgi:hypothetical protein